MIHTKPSGKIGPVLIHIDDKNRGKSQLSFQPLVLPATKKEIEAFFIKKFVSAMQKAGASIKNIEENSENDFDYTLTLPGGEVYLELSEVIIGNGKKCPYLESNTILSLKNVADAVLQTVRNKNEKYKGRFGKPIHLLLYITHWRFAIPKSVLPYIYHQLLNMKHVFEDIFIYVPLDDDMGVLTAFSDGKVAMLSPTPQEYNTSSQDIPDGPLVTLNPNKWKWIQENI